MNIFEKIDNIEAAIFDYEVSNVAGNVVSVFSDIVGSGAIDTGNPQTLLALNALMGDCLSAMQQSDFLLLADLLEYRLKPMLEGRAA